MNEPDDCPFTYTPGTEPPVREVVGVCVRCGCNAYIVEAPGVFLCFPCAYSRAN